MFNAIKKALKRYHDYDYQPTILIADASQAIHNGFMAAFYYNSLSDFIRVMCWSHVERNCEDWLKSIDNDTKQSILQSAKVAKMYSFVRKMKIKR